MKYAHTRDTRGRNGQISRDRLARELAHLPVVVIGVGYKIRIECTLCAWTTSSVRREEIEDHAAGH